MTLSESSGHRLQLIYKQLFKHYGAQHWWPGETPFEVMVGAILTQNTAWTNVEQAIVTLKLHQALDAKVLLKTSPARLAEWIRPSGYFNIKAGRLQNYCRWYVDQGGYTQLEKLDTVQLRAAILSVNGVGPETADDILLYAFNRAVFVIDAYTRRLMSRLGVLDGEQPYEVLRSFLENSLSADVDLYNEYHALIVQHAKQVCRPKPRCEECFLRQSCPAAPG